MLGALFESLVTLCVRVYARAAEAAVHHMRARDGKRVADLIVHLWVRQLGFPALAANAVNAGDGRPAFMPYFIKKVSLGRHASTLRVGILGLTNPGTAIWDRANVQGKLRFDDMIATARKWVPIMRRRGADVVLISAHGGDSGTSSYGPELPIENPTALIAQQVPGIDAILFGHAHAEVVERFVVNEQTDAQVLLSEPSKWGQRLTRMDFTLTRERGRWTIGTKRATMLNTNTVPRTRRCSPPYGPSTRRPSRTSTRSLPPRPSSCPPPSRGTGKRRSSTSSTGCRPTR